MRAESDSGALQLDASVILAVAFACGASVIAMPLLPKWLAGWPTNVPPATRVSSGKPARRQGVDAAFVIWTSAYSICPALPSLVSATVAAGVAHGEAVCEEFTGAGTGEALLDCAVADVGELLICGVTDSAAVVDDSALLDDADAD
jgi:hypothetical protein